MNHLPLLLLVVVLIAAGIFMVVGGGGEPDGPGVPPTESPRNMTPEPATPPTPSSPKKPTPHPDEAVDEAGRRVAIDLTQKVEKFVLEDVSVAEALEEIGRRLGCEVSFTDGAWTLVGSSSGVALHVEDVSAQTILDLLTEPHGVVYRVQGGVLWILQEGEEPPETGR